MKYSGTQTFQTFEDRPYMRITFTDSKNVWGGAVKKLFGNRFCVQVYGKSLLNVLACYDIHLYLAYAYNLTFNI